MPHLWKLIDGASVLYVDYRNLSSKEIIDLAREVDNITRSHEDSLMYIVNVEGVTFTTKMFIQIMSEKIGEVFSRKHECIVCLGVSGVKKLMFNTFTRMYKIKTKLLMKDEEAIGFLKEYIASKESVKVMA